MDVRRFAMVFARGRSILGFVLLVAPGPVIRLWFGRDANTAALRAMTRMMGARDVVLGLGALTSIKERTQGPEWLSMGALADGVDALVSATAPGLPRRGRAVTLLAAAASGAGLKLARDLADERAAEAAAEATAAT